MAVTLGQAAELIALGELQNAINSARNTLDDVQDQLNNRARKAEPNNDVENAVDTSSNVRARSVGHGGIPVALSLGTTVAEDVENARKFRDAAHADVDQFIADRSVSELAGLLLILKRQYVNACEHDKAGTRAALDDARGYLSGILDETNPETVRFHTVGGGTAHGPGTLDEVPVRFPTKMHEAAAMFTQAFPPANTSALNEAARREELRATEAALHGAVSPIV